MSRGRSHAGREDLGQARGGARALSPREMVPLASDHHGRLAGRLEKSRWITISSPITCRSPSGLYRMFHTGLRGPAFGAGASRGLSWIARATLHALVRAPVSVDHRARPPPICPKKLRRCWRFLQRTAELRHRCVSPINGFLSAPARRPGKCNRARKPPYGLPARQCGAARRALPEQSHQHPGQTTRTSGCVNRVSAPRFEQLSAGPLSKSKATCSSSQSAARQDPRVSGSPVAPKQFRLAPNGRTAPRTTVGRRASIFRKRRESFPWEASGRHPCLPRSGKCLHTSRPSYTVRLFGWIGPAPLEKRIAEPVGSGSAVRRL